MMLLGLRRALGPLDAGVHVLGVLAEDDDVHLLGLRHRRRRALEVAHRPDAGVEVEHLAQRDVQAADAAADRRRQRPLDRDLVRATASSVSFGSHSPYCSLAFSPASTSNQAMRLLAAERLLRPRRRTRGRWRARCRGRCRRLRCKE